MSDRPSSRALGIAERVRQCKDKMSHIMLVFNAVSNTVTFSIKVRLLLRLRTSIYLTSSAPEACCGHITEAWQ